MKTLALFIGLLLLLSLNAKGAYQNITNDLVVGNRVAASSSAVLQVESTTKGFLPPRMTSSQRDAIASPVEGLTIFNTTLNSIQVYAGGSWGNVGGGGSDHPIWTSSTSYGIGTIVIDSTDSNWKVYRANTAHTSTSSVFGDDFALSYWDELANNIDNITSSASSSVAVWDGASGDALGQTPVFIDSSGNITGVNTIDMASTLVASGSVTSTGLEVISTTEGSIPCPKMTEAERDLIGAPVVGNCVFNTTTNKLNIYDGVDWVSAGGGLSKWAASTSYKQYDVVWNDSDNKIYFAIADFTSAGSFVGANWTELSNDVNASGTVVDNAITRWDGPTGDSIQSSLVTIDDSGSINTPAGLTSNALTATGTVTFGTFSANSVPYFTGAGVLSEDNPGLTYDGSTLTLANAGASTLLDLTQSGSGTTFNINNSGSGDFLVVDTSKLIVQNNGEVGIGIAEPTSTLHVVGDIQVDEINLNANSIGISTVNQDLNLASNGTGDLNLTGDTIFLNNNVGVGNGLIAGQSDINPLTLLGSGERVVVSDPLEFSNSTPSTAAASGRTKLAVNSSGSVVKLSSDGLQTEIDKNRTLDIWYQENFSYTPLSSWTTGNSVVFGSSGTIDGALTRETSYAGFKGAVLKYVAGSSSTNDWFYSPSIAIDKEAGKHNGATLHYSWDGDTEVNLVYECTAGATWLASSTVASATTTVLTDTFYPDPNCTSIRYGFQDVQGATTSDTLVFDDVELSTNPFVYKEIVRENTLTATSATDGTISGEIEDFISGNCTNAHPSVCTFVTGFFSEAPNCSVDNTTDLTSFCAAYGTTTSGFNIKCWSDAAANITTTTQKKITCSRQGSDYGQTTEHVMTPVKSNMADGELYTPTFTGFGTVVTSNVRQERVGDKLRIYGTFLVGATPTATEARISLPSGLVSSSAISTLETAGGKVGNATAAAGRLAIPLIEPSVSYITFGYSEAAHDFLSKSDGNAIAAGATTISFDATVPIEGWTSDVAFLGANPLFIYAVDVDASEVLTNNDKTFVSSCTNADPSVCTIQTGFFEEIPRCWTANGLTSGVTATTITSATVDRTDASTAFTLICKGKVE